MYYLVGDSFSLSKLYSFWEVFYLLHKNWVKDHTNHRKYYEYRIQQWMMFISGIYLRNQINWSECVYVYNTTTLRIFKFYAKVSWRREEKGKYLKIFVLRCSCSISPTCSIALDFILSHNLFQGKWLYLKLSWFLEIHFPSLDPFLIKPLMLENKGIMS